MTCTSCGGRKEVNIGPKEGATVRYAAQAATPVSTMVVPRSESKELVKLRYYGGGMAKKITSGCSSCRGIKGGYSVTTTETIMFVSDDAPNGLYKQTVSVGHTYLVTRAQADYMLKLTYRDVAGREQPKFKEIKE